MYNSKMKYTSLIHKFCYKSLEKSIALTKIINTYCLWNTIDSTQRTAIHTRILVSLPPPCCVEYIRQFFLDTITYACFMN